MEKKRTVATYVLELLRALGVRHVFGIPGDYINPFAEALDAFAGIENVTIRDEPTAGFAARMYAEALEGNVPGVCYATYGAGGRKMINPLLDAKVNAVPVVFFGGEIGLNKRQIPYYIHHQATESDFTDQRDIFKRELGDDFAISIREGTKSSAPIVIREMILRALHYKRPVYIGVPKDVWTAETEECPPLARGTEQHREPPGFSESVGHAVQSIRLTRRCVLAIGKMARGGIDRAALAFGEKLGLPIVSFYHDVGTIAPTHSLYAGMYAAQASVPPKAQVLVEESDCLIQVGVMECNANYGLRQCRIPETARGKGFFKHPCIRFGPELRIPFGLWPDRYYREFFHHVGERALAERGAGKEADSATTLPSPEIIDDSDARLTMSAMVRIVNEFLRAHPQMPVVADTGNAMFVGLKLACEKYFGPGAYGTLGNSVGALGVEKALQARTLVIVGDGAFLMYLGEIVSSFIQHAVAPIIVVLDNSGWQMLNLERKTDCFTFPRVPFADIFGHSACFGFHPVLTKEHLRRALDAAWGDKRPSILAVHLEPEDYDEALLRFMAKP